METKNLQSNHDHAFADYSTALLDRQNNGRARTQELGIGPFVDGCVSVHSSRDWLGLNNHLLMYIR